MNILLFGKHGQLGSELRKLLPRLGTVTSLDYKDLDLCDADALQQLLHDLKPQLIVNASAYTAVDRAETEHETAMKINAVAPGLMAEWSRTAGAALIHYSTDYVFDGRKGSPYVESDPVNPLNVYGKSKLAGEKNIEQAGDTYWIFRTSWVYSVGGKGVVSKVLEWSRKKRTLKIVSDQISNPTWARDLAEATFSVVAAHRANLQDVMKERRGIYHLAGDGYTSRYEWAREILANDPKRTEQLVQTLEPASSDEFPLPALRPLFSALDCSKFKATFGFGLPDWRVSLRECLKTLEKSEDQANLRDDQTSTNLPNQPE